MKYKRLTTRNTAMPVYLILAYMIGVMTLGVFLIAYLGFSRVNKTEEKLLSPLTGIELIRPIYASETIPDDKSLLHKLYLYVRWNESSDGTKGLAVTCRKKGGVNEVGYLPVKGYCFSSQQEQEITVKQWFAKRITIQGLTPREALMVYTGNANYALNWIND